MTSKKHTILLVDDDPDILQLISYNLEREGYKVVCAKDGEEAVAKTKQHYPSLILLDVMMPNMDGMDVAKQIKANPKLTEIKLIAYTADAMSAQMSQLKSSGFDDVLLKPLHREGLFKVLALSDISHF